MSAKRSSWARNSADSSSWPARSVATALSLVQCLEVLLDLRLEVAGHLLAGDGLLHHLPVLPEDAQVLQARRHVGAASDHVGVEPLLAPGPRLALDAHVVGVGPQALGRITLGVGALPAAREETFALREVALVTRPSRLPAPAIPPALSTAALALAPPTEALPVPALLFHGAHLGQRALHRLQRLVGLSALERLHALGDVSAPVVGSATLAPEPLHLVQQLTKLLRRDLARVHPAPQGFGPLEDHVRLPLGIVLLEIRQPVDLLQHPDALVALLQAGVEVGRLPAERGVLEDRREVAGLALPPRAQAGDEVALLHVGAMDGLPLDAPGSLGGLELARAVLRLVFLFLARDGEVVQDPLRERYRACHRQQQ